LTREKAAIVLAAGKGKRMKSDLPKVLHAINGRPMITFLLDTLVKIGFERIVVVVGHKGELVREALADYPVEFVWQREQRGTGDAVKCAGEIMKDFDGITLVAAGDVPFLSATAIQALLEKHETTGASATCLSAVFDDPSEYGRIVREDSSDRLREIVEHKDASGEVRALKEINTGTFCFDNRQLFEALALVQDDNTQGEYYLTDVVKIMHSKSLTISVMRTQWPDEVRGVNSADDLAYLAERFGRQL